MSTSKNKEIDKSFQPFKLCSSISNYHQTNKFTRINLDRFLIKPLIDIISNYLTPQMYLDMKFISLEENVNIYRDMFHDTLLRNIVYSEVTKYQNGFIKIKIKNNIENKIQYYNPFPHCVHPQKIFYIPNNVLINSLLIFLLSDNNTINIWCDVQNTSNNFYKT